MKKASIFMIATLLAAIVLMGFAAGAQGFGATDSTNKQTQANKVPSSIDSGGVGIDDDPMLGDKDAVVTLLEFADFQGPFSQNFWEETLPLIKENYISSAKINYVFRDFPLDFYFYDQIASEASECIDEQGNGLYWRYHDTLFENQDEWSNANNEKEAMRYFTKYAKSIPGTNVKEFSKCLSTHAMAQEVQEDREDGEKAGVVGTPTFFVINKCGDEEQINGAQPYHVFEKAILESLENCDPKETVDIAVTHLIVSPDEPKVNDNINVVYTIKNLGDDVEEVHFGYTVDGPNGGFGSGGCCITLHPDESHEVEFNFVASETGEYTISVNAWPEYSEDQDPSNNELSLTFNVRDIILIIGDFDGNEIISVVDLLALLANWGTDNALYDEDGSGIVDQTDLKMTLANWGEGKMLRGDFIHYIGHCKITYDEVALLKTLIGHPVNDAITRLADIDNDGEITEEDFAIIKIQKDLTENDITYLREDLNCNGVMDNKDIEILTSLWGPKDYDDTWADVNSDGDVNASDLLQALGAF